MMSALRRFSTSFEGVDLYTAKRRMDGKEK